MINHQLKSHPEPFDAAERGEKKHEVRVWDRDYRVGDQVTLRRWDPITKTYSGRLIIARITNITLPGTWGLPDKVGVFSFENINQHGSQS